MLQNQILKRKKILQNQQEIEELGQYGRRLCLRFEGIPTEKNETSDKVLEKIMTICKESGVEIPDTIIDRAHRIGRYHISTKQEHHCSVFYFSPQNNSLSSEKEHEESRKS